jgi:hypothetical protein
VEGYGPMKPGNQTTAVQVPIPTERSVR